LIVRGRFGEARMRLKPLAYSPHESSSQRAALAMLEALDEKATVKSEVTEETAD
jgi:hypothetical protein